MIVTDAPSVSPSVTPSLAPTLAPTAVPIDIGWVANRAIFDIARQQCYDRYHTDLAVVPNYATQLALEKDLSHKSYYTAWIGLRNVSGEFEWVDGKTPLQYTNWGPNEPNPEHDCVAVHNDGYWYTERCLGAPWGRGYFCQMPFHFIDHVQLNYSDARAFCQSEFGTDLAVIDNEFINEEMHQSAYPYVNNIWGWFGLNDLAKEGDFQWVDGDYAREFTRWYPGTPSTSDDGYDCAFMGDRWWHNNALCSREYHFYCRADYQSTWVDATAGASIIYVVNSYSNYLDYAGAREFCFDQYTTDLAVVPDAQTNDAMWYQGGHFPWIGLYEYPSNGHFRWVDGVTREYTNYRSTCCGDCYTIKYTGKWDDRHCTANTRFFCEPPYKLVTAQPLSYNKARDYCRANYGTDLVSIDNKQINQAMHNSVKRVKGNAWIGLQSDSASASGSGYSWLDGESSRAYTEWREGNPNAANGDCVAMDYYSGRWQNADCNEEMYFVCGKNRAWTVPDVDHILVSPWTRMTWTESKQYCQDIYGMTLSSFHSAADYNDTLNELIIPYTAGADYWIGVIDEQYSNIDDSPMDFAFWKDGHRVDVNHFAFAGSSGDYKWDSTDDFHAQTQVLSLQY